MINYMKLLLALPAIASRSLPRTWYFRIFCLYGSRMRCLPIFQSTKHPRGKFYACGEEMPILHAFALRPRFYNAGPIFSSSLMVLDVFVLGIGNAPFPFFTSFVDRDLSPNFLEKIIMDFASRHHRAKISFHLTPVTWILFAWPYMEQQSRDMTSCDVYSRKLNCLTCTGIK